MRTIKILKSRINKNVIIYDENITKYNKEYWDIFDLDVEDDYDIESGDLSEYLEQIKEMHN